MSPLTFCALFCTLTVTDTSLNSTPVTPTLAWESITISIVQRYIPWVHNVQIISEKTDVSDTVLRTIQVPVQLLGSYLCENSLVVLLSQSESFLHSILQSAGNATRSKVVILVECPERVSVTWILEMCWKKELLDVVVIPIKNDLLQVYTYFPFRNGACFDPTPVLMYSYNDSFQSEMELFPRRKVWNLQKCTVKVSTFAYQGIYFDRGELKGRFSSIFKAVAESMNFSHEFVNTEGKDFFGSVSGPEKTGMRADVFFERAHFGFIPYLSPIDRDYLDYDSLAMTSCLTWCLPVLLKEKSIWWYVVGEFTPSVWLMIFLSAMSILATDFLDKKFDQHKYHDENVMYLNIWASLLQVSGRYPRYSLVSSRAVWISWVLSTLVLSTGYLSTLKSFRTAKYIEYLVKNLEDFVESDIQPWYLQGFAELVDDASAEYPVVARLKSKSYLYQANQTGASVRMMGHKNISLLLSDNECGVVADMHNQTLDVYPLPEACLQVTSWHFFVLKKNSIFTEAISTIVDWLTQGGFVQRNLRSQQPKCFKAVIEGQQISVNNMIPALFVLVCGLSFSFSVLVIEILLPYVWPCKGL